MSEAQITGNDTLQPEEQHESWNSLHGSDEYKNQILAKFFPSIRYGRDTDLDQYISLRERGKPLKEWKNYYDNLARKYTENERKKLIQSFRKQIHHFQQLFKQILTDLYARVENLLKQQIDTLLNSFKDILGKELSLFSNKDFFNRIGQALKIFSEDRYEALSHLDLLCDFAQKMHYRNDVLEQVVHFIKGYLNGSLFLETKKEETYHFDINEEKAQNPFRPKTARVTPLPMQLFLTAEDLNKIILNTENLNEYELCFAYLDRYIQLLEDEDFATKIFVYSKKYRTEHYQIFDRIRKGISFNHQKERIFDDVFKIICGGRYVYDIRLEKFISYKLRLLANSSGKQSLKHTKQEAKKGIAKEVKKGIKKEKRLKAGNRRVVTALKSKQVKPAKPVGIVKDKEVKVIKPKSTVKKLRTPALHKTSKAKPKAKVTKKLAVKERRIVKNSVTSGKKSKVRTQARHAPRPALTQRTALSVTEMIFELSEQKLVQRRLIDEFKKRLPESIREMQSFGLMILGPTSNQAEGKNDKQQDELIHFVLQNYDKILIEHNQTDYYREQLEKLGASLHTIYTAILNCLNKLKTDYFTHKEKFEKTGGFLFFGR